jgi:5-methylcytosine-specific restriction protein A
MSPSKPLNPCRQRGCPNAATNGGYCRAHALARDKERRRANPVKRPSASSQGYGVDWRKLRAAFLAEHPTCVICGAPAIVADHVIPKAAGGDDDWSNLQALCRSCHGKKTATENNLSFGRRPPLASAPVRVPDACRVTVLCGPPGSGKTTYAREHVRWGHLVVDLDAIYRALSFMPAHDKPHELLPFVLDARDAVIARLGRAHDVRQAWILTSAADAETRQRFRDNLGAKIIVFEVAPHTCIMRINNDPERKGKGEIFAPLINDWWKKYRPTPGDEIIRD